MDLLSDVLAVSGVRGAVGARIEAAGTWGVSWVQDADAVVYAVTAGTAWLEVAGEEPLQLVPGDVVLLPRGSAHGLASAPGTVVAPCDLAGARAAREAGGVLRLGERLGGAGGAVTRVLGASYRHDPTVTTQVLTLLPDVVHLRSDQGGSCLDDTVRLVARELANPRLATAVVLDRLVDVLLVQLLRVWVEAAVASGMDDAGASWLRALADPLVSRALELIHAQPARPWTTGSLAAQVGVSRATLARRFPAVVGQGPGAYLAQWRMDLAARRLRDTDAPLEAVARAVGYTSVHAFSRAFARARAQPPGRYRASSRGPVGRLTA